MKTQKEFIEAVMDGKKLRCGTVNIYLRANKIFVSGDGLATSGDSFESSKDENFVHLKNYLGVSVIVFYVKDWVVA